MIITKIDLIYHLELGITTKKLNEMCNNDDRFNQLLNDFITNNYIHYCASIKMKESIQEYKESTILLEQNTFSVDYSTLSTIGDIAITTTKTSLGLDIESDVDKETRDKILSTVEKFN